MRTGSWHRKQRFRVDLHGVSIFGPGDRHTLIRWEWITAIVADTTVVVRSHKDQIAFPDGAFGMTPRSLAEALNQALSIDRRGEVIGRLAGGRSL